MGFFTRMFLTASSNGGSDSDLLRKHKHKGPREHSSINSPFFWRNHFHYSCLHSVFVDLLDEGLKVSKLVHGLKYPVSLFLNNAQYLHDLVCGTCSALTGLKTGILPPP